MSVTLKSARLEILQSLVSKNSGKEDCTTCSIITCPVMYCSECPLKDDKCTLGDVRSELQVRLQHAPDCLWILGRTEGITKPCTCGVINKEDHNDDDVKTPSHYMLFEDIESIQVIARTMTQEEFKGFCLGNVLKYRLRAGKKSELATVEKDLAKAEYYKELFNKHKGECRVSK